MTARIELLPSGNAGTSGFRTVEWASPEDRTASHLNASVGPWLKEFGQPSDATVGLARTSVAVFLADRLVPRNELRQERDIELRVPVSDPSGLMAASGELDALLRWLTGDRWTLVFVQDETPRPTEARVRQAVAEVSLLSGGLDSFCGALAKGVGGRLFLSHWDASVIRHSQKGAIGWMAGCGLSPNVLSVQLAPPPRTGREPSRRSRSFLFMGLAVALADAVGARTIEVPENGFTSLNVPLAANRGGVLTTRSTHPCTMRMMDRVLAALGLSVELSNPYEFLTKGELIQKAVDAGDAGLVEDGLVHTLSCGKTNPMLRGKGFGNNCGLDYACVVRRGAVLAAGLTDNTSYLVNILADEQQEELIKQRQGDISAVKLALARGASMDALVSLGGFPGDYDLERALAVWERGLEELGRVPLP